MHDIGAGLEMENWIEDSQPTNAEERLQVTPTHHCMQWSLCWNRAHRTGVLELTQLGCACQQLLHVGPGRGSQQGPSIGRAWQQEMKLHLTT